MAASVSIIIATIEDSRALRTCLEEVGRQAREMGAEQVLVINRPPSDFDDAARSELEALVDRVLFVPKPGKSNALNAAVAEATSDIIAFTDDDARPASDWLREVCRPLQDDETLSGVGGQVQPVFEVPPPRWYRRLLSRHPTNFLGPVHFVGNAAFDYIVDPTWRIYPIGCNFAFRRTALLEVPFPTAIGPNIKTGGRGGEDVVLARKLLTTGHRILYEPRARVFHPVDPARTTMPFVRKRYEVQGWEGIEMLRAVNARLPDPRYLARHARPLGWWKRLTRGSFHRISHEMKAIEAASALAHMESLGLLGTAPAGRYLKGLSAVLIADAMDDRLRTTVRDIGGRFRDIVVVGPSDVSDALHADPAFEDVRFYGRPADLPREELVDYALDQAWADWSLLLEPGECVVGDAKAIRRITRRRKGTAHAIRVERNGTHQRETRLVLNDTSARHRTGALPGTKAPPTNAVRVVS